MTKNDIDTLEELNNRLNNEGWKSETNNKIIDMLPEIIKELKTRITLKEIFEETKKNGHEIAGLRKHFGMIAHE
jgi:hypothetical protein